MKLRLTLYCNVFVIQAMV